MAEKTHEGRPPKLLCVVDEYTRECLAIVVARRITSHEMLMTLADLFLEHGIPEHIRSDNGHEFQAKFHSHVEDQGIRHVYIKPRSPNLNGKVERSHLTDKLEFHQLLAYTDDVDTWPRSSPPGRSPTTSTGPTADSEASRPMRSSRRR